MDKELAREAKLRLFPRRPCRMITGGCCDAPPLDEEDGWNTL